MHRLASRLLCAAVVVLAAGCKDDSPCQVDGDCDRYAQAVCNEGRCVCAFDELERCLCDEQSWCDALFGAGVRQCIEGACRACREDADCGALGRCNADGECFLVECEADADCAVGYCRQATNDCVGCRTAADCPATAPICRDDGASVRCTSADQCAPTEVCDIDIVIDPTIEIVGTNQCGRDCAPMCREACLDDPACQMRPACVVEDPACLGDGCATWDDCELPDACELRLGPCPDGVACEALAASFLVPIHYACLPTPCLYDFECDEAELCYEGRCLAGCADASDCPPRERCVARVHFSGSACVPD